MRNISENSKLNIYLKTLCFRDTFVFNSLSLGMDYNYVLKMIPLFNDFNKIEYRNLDYKKEFIKQQLILLEEENFDESFKNKKLKIYKKELDSNWTNIHTTLCNHNFDFSILELFSDARRIKLGINPDLITFLVSVQKFKDNQEALTKFKTEIKSRLARNNIKEWADILPISSMYSSHEYIGQIQYEQYWSKLLQLKNNEFKVKSDKYRIHFCDTGLELMFFGLKFKTCLSELYKAKSMIEGEQATLIVFKNDKPFSSLTIMRTIKGFGIDMMRTYNNAEIDTVIWKKVEARLKKLSK